MLFIGAALSSHSWFAPHLPEVPPPCIMCVILSFVACGIDDY